MNYLKKFNNISDYEVFKGGEEFITPNVSLITDNNSVMYNPKITLGEKAFKCVYSNNSFLSSLPFNTSFLMKDLVINGSRINIKDTIEGDKIINCISQEEEKRIICLASEINIDYENEKVNLPRNYFISNPTSAKLKSLNNNIDFMTKNAALVVFYDNESFLVESISISYAIQNGLIYYNETDNTFIASNLLLNYSMGLPFCVVIFDENETGVNIYDTEIIYNLSNISIKSYDGISIISIPSNYWVYEPTYYYLKPIDNNININNDETYIIMFTNEKGIYTLSKVVDSDNIIYNTETNEYDLMNFYKNAFLFHKILFLEQDNPLVYFALCDIDTDNGNIIKIYDTIIKTDGKTNDTLSYSFKKKYENYVEFIMADETKCPLFTYKLNLSEIIVPDGVTSIDDYTFANCGNLKTLKIPDTVTDIGDCAFISSSIEEFIMSDNVIHIGRGLFCGCDNLKTVVLSKHITQLEDYSSEPWGFFGYCSSLEHITIPKNVSSLGYWCFDGCSSLSSIRCEAIEAPMLGGEYTFGRSFPSTGTLYYPEGSDYSTWIAALPSGWTTETFIP